MKSISKTSFDNTDPRYIDAQYKKAPTSFRHIRGKYGMRYELPFYSLFDSLLLVGTHRRGGTPFPQHYHDFFEFHQVIEGQGTFWIDEVSIQVRAGDVLLIKPGELHSIEADSHLSLTFYQLGFQLGPYRSLEAELYTWSSYRPVNDTQLLFASLCDQMISEIEHNRPHAHLVVQSDFLKLLVTMLRLYHTDAACGGGELTHCLNPVIRELLDLLNGEIHCQHNIQELAGRLHVSSIHLQRQFKEAMGVPLGFYIRTLCFEKAKYMLQETDASVSQIADGLWFNSLQSFSIFFKRMALMSPQEYRRLRENDE